jgi:hypothetical protein
MSEISDEKAKQSSDQPTIGRPDDVAFDDELIETTFANEPGGSIAHSETIQDEVQVEGRFWETVSPLPFESGDGPGPQNGNSAAFAEHREEPLGEEFIPSEMEFAQPHTETNEPDADTNTADLSLAPTEEFQIDQSGDEAYFEPAPEMVEQPGEAQNEQFEEASHSETASIWAEEPVGHDEESVHDGQQLTEHQTDQSQTGAEPSAESRDHETEQRSTEEHLLPPTPWESVAEPQPERFSLDESNLLELPAGFGNRTGETKVERETEVSSTAAAIAPDIVDEIARATAMQISEELVREIAQRIVPKVIEEVLARRKSENIDE